MKLQQTASLCFMYRVIKQVNNSPYEWVNSRRGLRYYLISSWRKKSSYLIIFKFLIGFTAGGN